jgi:hemerythrin
MIQWNDDFTIGVKAIDEQHKRLFDIANRAYQLLRNELVLDKYDQIVDIFEELKDYTVYHFTYEERYMAEIGYKKLLSHKVYHDDFIEKVKDIDFNKVDQDQEQYLTGILDFVVHWIKDHILGVDKKIGQG